MLKLQVKVSELYDEQQGKFVYDTRELLLEHSLYTISKWEERNHKPFLSNNKLTNEMALDYVLCMVVNEEDKDLIRFLSEENVEEIDRYIRDPATATTFSSEAKKSRRIITSEEIYAKMIFSGVPFECQHWHYNKLTTLLRVIDEKSNPKKMSKREIMDRYKTINEQRKRKLNMTG